MLNLDQIEFPSKQLTCYESVLMTLLKHQGVCDEPRLMGTQAYFVFTPSALTISAKFNSVDQEWRRLYGRQPELFTVQNEDELHNKIKSLLDADVPVCLPVDLFSLPHTLHHKQLHQHHYINIFGVDNGRYYMVCPYYRFQGWVDADLIHSSFFSQVVATKGAFLITLPKFTLPPIDPQTIITLVEDNCRYMLNLATPESVADVDSRYLGIAGMQTFAHHFQRLADEPDNEVTYKSAYVNLSRHLTAVSHSRYWFHKLIQNHQPDLLSTDLQRQFEDVVQAWKAIGIRLGMAVHGGRANMMQTVAISLKKMHEQETRLFNTLLGALPDYEQGTL
ncbi:MAG: hypothetical protein GY943_11040 [Chloroflexi bacterium]|nr:hypothetical protein [Chloroflexota bacterium]